MKEGRTMKTVAWMLHVETAYYMGVEKLLRLEYGVFPSENKLRILLGLILQLLYATILR